MVSNLTSTPNFNVLKLGLKKNYHYKVKNGELTLAKNIPILYPLFFKKSREREAGKIINGLIEKILLEKTPESSSNESFKKLVLNQLSQLPKSLFNRSVLNRDFIHSLHPQLNKTVKTEENKDNIERKIERRIEKTRLAIKLGVDLKRISKGNSGSYFSHDYKGKVLGVFKPGREASLGHHSPKILTRIRNFILQKILRVNIRGSFWKGEGHISEVLTYELAKQLNLTIVPPSQITTLTSRAFVGSQLSHEGSFQLYIKNAKSAEEALKLKSKYPIIGELLLKRDLSHLKSALNVEEFESTALIDFLTCNRDRHFENILLTGDKNAPLSIHLIDNELGFPKRNPPKMDKLYRRDQYKWAVLPQAKQNFSKKSEKLIKSSLRGAPLEALLKHFNQISSLSGKRFDAPYKINSQELAFKIRITALLISMEKGRTMRQVAKLKSHEELRGFLNKHGQGIDEASINQFLGVK